MAGLLEVGRIGRAHGLKGEVAVSLWADRPERVAPGQMLHTDHGDLCVASSRPHQGRWLVHFVDVTDRTAAEQLAGLTLHAPPSDEPGTLWVHELIGADVVRVDAPETIVGRVSAVESNPASDLLVLESGSLVPLRFVVSHEPGSLVVVDVPDGLIDELG
jgi:16S rRNA processing protein RimM